MPIIDLVYFNAGGGHRASALALEAAIRAQQRPWQVRLVNLFEVLDPQESFRRVMGFAPEAYYNQRLAKGWTLGLAQELKLLQGMIRLGHTFLVNTLRQHWLATEPDLVVSMVPNFNRALYESLASALPGVPYVTVLTDLADLPPHFWIEPRQPQHFVCGTPRALQQALAAGHPPERVHASSGMILRPDFHRSPAIDRAAERRRLGLDPDRPTGLVMFGGQGSRTMRTIARELSGAQLILVCGHNDALAKALRAQQPRAAHHVMGYSADIARTMQLADFFIGKPGPGSLSEALQMGLPVIVAKNRWTMPQERYNADWVRERQAGLVLPGFSRIGEAVDEMLRRLPELRSRVSALPENRAVFEIPALLEGILARGAAPSPMARRVALRG